MRLHTPTDPDPIRLVGFLLGSGFVGLVVLFVSGAALTDPGGWRGVGLTVAWLLPLVGLSSLALLHPRSAIPVLAVLTLLPVGFGAWNVMDHDSVRGWEDSHGPVSLVLLVGVAAGLVVLGLSRPGVAGMLLLIATLVPTVLGMVGAGGDWPHELSINLVAAPLVATGVLFVVAAKRPNRTPESPHQPTSARA
ncbi:MAG TPA: hypothetical protein VFQ17_08235 [Nocardioides sp.]|nr:hypothetical protein [Nocardioides sp.]